MQRDTGEEQNVAYSPRGTRRQLIRSAAMMASIPVLGNPGTAVAQSATPDVDVVIMEADPEPTFATSPSHGSRTASPHTTISIRGLTAAQLGEIRVEGAVSGDHSGVVVEHPDGNGFSWLPDDMFEPGEHVTVTAGTALSDVAGGELEFRVAVPAQRITSPVEPVEPAADLEDRYHTFVSRPDLFAPKISVTTQPIGTAPGLLFLTPTTPTGTTGRLIADEWGQPVWIGAPAQHSHGNFNLEVNDYRGQPLIAWWEGAKTIGYGFGHWTLADSSYEPVATIQGGNGISGIDVHEILLTARGTAIVVSYTPIEWNLARVGGNYTGNALDNIIQEIDIETGLVLWEWHSLDHVAIAESYEPLPDDPDVPWDYFHLNAISFDADGHLLVSARHTYAVYKVHRLTGDVIWRLNGKRSDFEMGPGTFFAYQHDANRQPDGTVSIFDNAENQNEILGADESRLIFLRLDLETMTATLEREVIHDTGILSVSQGNLQLLPNGNYFVGWGSAPVFSEYDETGDMTYNARFPEGVQSYRAFRYPWTGRPSAPPDVAVRGAADGSLTAYISWNGATDVAAWRVLGGDSPDDLRELAIRPKARFETAIPLGDAVDWIVVEALDAWDGLLGRSDAIAINGA